MITTASPIVLIMRRFLIFIAAFLTYTPFSIACSPVQAIDVLFAANSSHISAQELFKLANFMVKIDINFPNHELVIINGTASALEKNSLNLANARANQVATYLRRTQYRGKFLIDHSYVWKLSDLDHTSTDGLAAEVLFVPAPPHACSGMQ